MSTSPHTKNPWHWKQTKQVMRDYFRILLRSVKFNSGLRWKVWPRASFRAHTVQLATLRQDTSSRRAAGIQAHCPAVDSQHSSALKWPMLLADLRAKGHCQTPSEKGPHLISSHLISRKYHRDKAFLSELLVVASFTRLSTDIHNTAAQSGDRGCQTERHIHSPQHR